MSIQGIGTDICAIDRIEAVMARFGVAFEHRVLAESERIGTWTPRKLARRWAIKEAVAKAFGCGIGKTMGFHDIEVRHDALGKPLCTVRGFEGVVVHISTSDDTAYATAFAVVENR